MEASASREALQAAIVDKGQLSVVNIGLSEGLERQTVRKEELSAAASALEAQLAEAAAEVTQQRSQLQAVGTETMNMRQAMALMKEQAGKMVVQAHAAAETAATQRAEADKQYAEVASALEEERTRMASVKVCVPFG